MSTAIEPSDLLYPSKPDANGYAKKYFKRRAFYFGAFNSPESYVLFGEWKRRLIESGVATEVKVIRKDLAEQATTGPHAPLGGPVERKPLQFAMVTLAISAMLLGAVIASAKIISSSVRPTVDGIALTSEEMDFVRGHRMHKNFTQEDVVMGGQIVAELTERLMEEGAEGGEKYLSDPDL